MVSLLYATYQHLWFADAFNDFKDENGGFKTSLSLDLKGMLSLYEASHLALQGETILDEARAFTSTHLMDIRENIDPVLQKKKQSTPWIFLCIGD